MLLGHLHDLAHRPGRDPALDRRVQLGLVGEPSRGGAEPALLDQVGSADHPHQALGDGGGAATDREPVPVGGAEEVARRGERRVVAGASLDLAELVEDRDLGPSSQKSGS
jgi:hypothetical protein